MGNKPIQINSIKLVLSDYEKALEVELILSSTRTSDDGTTTFFEFESNEESYFMWLNDNHNHTLKKLHLCLSHIRKLSIELNENTEVKEDFRGIFIDYCKYIHNM